MRFSGSAHPSWLGFQDRHLFPPFEDDPSYFFIRKFNSVGNNFEEKKLINWIEKYHYDEGPPPECNIQMMSVRKECLKQIGSEIAYKNQIIVIPVNVPFWNYAQNLQCSLLKLGIKNVVYWALDLEIYETLLNAGSMTIYLPGVDPSPLLILPNSPDLNNIMRAKTKVIKMFMDAGFDLWFLDSDTVVLKDFRDVVPGIADVLVALDNIDYLKKGPEAAKPSTGIMFFKNSKGGQTILKLYIESLQLAMLLDDQNGLSRILTKADAIKTLMPEEVPKNPIKIPVVQYLNPFSFINSNVFISNPQAIPSGFKNYYIFHTKSKRDHVDTLQSLGYWFLDDEMRCHLIISAPKDNGKR